MDKQRITTPLYQIAAHGLNTHRYYNLLHRPQNKMHMYGCTKYERLVLRIALCIFKRIHGYAIRVHPRIKHIRFDSLAVKLDMSLIPFTETCLVIMFMLM